MLNNQLGSPIMPINKIIKICILFIAVLVGTIVYAKAQSVSKVSDKVLKDTTISNKSYKLYLGSRGGKYVVRVSKLGREYKQYFKAK